MTIEEKRLEVLNDTIKYFNSNNRCEDGVCQYSPIPDKSEGCAVGRLIKDKALCKEFDVNQSGYGGTGVRYIFNALPVELQELGMGFLSDLQSLHDDWLMWDENGLNEQGSKEIERIKLKYKI